MSRLLLPDGVILNILTAEANNPLPLVFLHGFTGSAANWQSHLEHFAGRYHPLAIDLLGHGDSDSPPDLTRYRIEQCVADLTAVFDQLGLERVALVGYSMGGRVALAFTLTHPERVQKLILESASPGLATAEERATRIASDEALAQRIESEGIEAFVSYWENIPLFTSQQHLPEATRAALRAQRLHNNSHGLANSLRGLGTGVQPSFWERLSEIQIPTLLLAGSLDPKFTAIAQQMAAAIPTAQLAIIPNAGHTLHLEQPDEFRKQINVISNW